MSFWLDANCSNLHKLAHKHSDMFKPLASETCNWVGDWLKFSKFSLGFSLSFLCHFNEYDCECDCDCDCWCCFLVSLLWRLLLLFVVACYDCNCNRCWRRVSLNFSVHTFVWFYVWMLCVKCYLLYISFIPFINFF